MKSFLQYFSLEKHLYIGKHDYTLEHETLYDKAKKQYAEKLEGHSYNPPAVTSTDNETRPSNPQALTNTNKTSSITSPGQMKMGWALKSSSKKKTFYAGTKAIIDGHF